MIFQQIDFKWVRENWKIITVFLSGITAFTTFSLHAEEALKQARSNKQQIQMLTDILNAQKNYEQGEQEGKRKAIEQICIKKNLSEEQCAELQQQVN